MPTEPPGDRSERLAPLQADADLDAVVEGEVIAARLPELLADDPTERQHHETDRALRDVDRRRDLVLGLTLSR